MADRIRAPLSEVTKAKKRRNSRIWYAAVQELIRLNRGQFLRIQLRLKEADDEQHD